ncbi:VOC family protein [Microbacterium sp. NPDC078428]|uniref:VOC family protein n=1 Tax=Microbacterium sp. NPDC078428 TaxID=3364190 RepID=UPI0037CACC4C
MFTTTQPFSSFSVDDIPAALAFYRDVLGFDVEEMPEMGLDVRLGGDAHIFIYPKDNHEPASFTVLNIPVSNIDEAVDELNGKGVATKIYDDADLPTDRKGINRDLGPAIAWFLDPARNVIAVIEMD